MFKILGNHESRILAVTRILLGVMLTCHGAQKLFGAFGGTQDPAWVVWRAGPIELLGVCWLSLYFGAHGFMEQGE